MTSMHRIYQGVKKNAKLCLRIIGLAVFIIILGKLDIGMVAGIVTEARLFYLLAAFVWVIPLLLLKAYRWYMLLKLQGLEYEFRSLFLDFLSSNYLGLATPGRAGEFTKVAYLKDMTRASWGKAFSSVIADRLLDLFVIIAIGSLGVLAYPFSHQLSTLMVLLLTGLLGVTYCLFDAKVGISVLGLWHKVRSGYTSGGNLAIHLADFYQGMGAFRRIKVAVAVVLSLLAYLCVISQGYLLARAIGITLSPLYLAFCMAIVSLVSLIPISISGIGTRDMVLIGLFSTQGIQAEYAVAFSTLMFFAFNVAAALLGALAWYKRPLNINLQTPD
jgi:uncharacterized protein (TIRG00374 family)